MKIQIAVLLSCFILTSCDDEDVIVMPNKWHCMMSDSYAGARCPKEYIYQRICETQKLADFIIKCAKAANPMSDEEGEDLVKECGSQGEKIYCNTVFLLSQNEYKK